MSEPFDPLAPLLQGPQLIEASAGTGKTYTLTYLACRYLAETDFKISQLLLITFSNAAANELRSKVHAQILKMSKNIKQFIASGNATEDLPTNIMADPKIALQRLDTALANFDSANISTIHSFCQEMLNRLGILSASDSSRIFLDSPQLLISEVLEDLYLKNFTNDTQQVLNFSSAKKLAQIATNTTCEIISSPGKINEKRMNFTKQVRETVALRKKRNSQFSFDDIILSLLAALNDPVSGTAVSELIAKWFPVVFVDEFQDTDPQQWQIIEKIFLPQNNLILIGDPKQLIYAFRNADINTYLAATESNITKYTLTTNYRSDEPIVTAINTLFRDADFGDDRIKTPLIKPTLKSRLKTAKNSAWKTKIRIRDISARTNSDNPKVVNSLVYQDLVQQVIELLNGEIFLETKDPQTNKYISRLVHPNDIAILVRNGWQAHEICENLHAAEVSAIYSGPDNVFTSSAAQDWLSLLAAILSPESIPLTQKASLTNLIGKDVFTLMADTEKKELEKTSKIIRILSNIYPVSGIAGIWESVREHTDLDYRILSQDEGERIITDLSHIAELLHAQQVRYRLGLDGLFYWLKNQIGNASITMADANNRRLESDTDAVSIVTIHSAKGLQYPIVLLPTLCDGPRKIKKTEPFVFPSSSGRKLITDYSSSLRNHAQTLKEKSDQQEEFRLLYVAMTRAESALMLWWYPTNDITLSPLYRLFFGSTNQKNHDHLLSISELSHKYPTDQISIETPKPEHQVFELPEKSELKPLFARKWTRSIDETWNRTSYSALTANTHDTLLSTESDEPVIMSNVVVEKLAELSQPSPMAELPAGPNFGTLVHAILEQFDPDSTKPKERLLELVELWDKQYKIPNLDRQQLANALFLTINTPLGKLADGLCLNDFGLSRRLAEFGFNIPLGTAKHKSTLSDLADLLSKYIPSDDPLGRYPSHLKQSQAAKQRLNGFLTGSIDVILQVGSDKPRFIVVDYKTNRLSNFDSQPSTIGDYTQHAMAEAMIEAHYPLQALLYCVALHRYLSWRLPNYNSNVHLGGVNYLFVRGMAGQDTPAIKGNICGCFNWYPSPKLIVAISDLLAGTL